MRNYLSIALLVFMFISSYSQEGFKHISLKGGFTHEGHVTFELGLEFNKKYYNNWTMFFSGFTKYYNTAKEENNWTTGIYYEPAILAVNNNLLHFRFGTSMGTNEKEFILDIIAGIEYNYAVNDWFKVGLFFKNSKLFFGSDEFRHAILGGIKIRL